VLGAVKFQEAVQARSGASVGRGVDLARPHQVLDCDTIRIDETKPDHRLVGFNAPETRRAKTEHERNLGAVATTRLREIVRGGNLDYSKVECSCKPGTASTQWCNFGRFCGVLKSNGVDGGQIPISEGLAVTFVCGATDVRRHRILGADQALCHTTGLTPLTAPKCPIHMT
jgi:hypothetical protein